MIDYGLFKFASPPRTATVWIQQACAAIGLKEEQYLGPHVPFECRGGVTLSCVRHPVPWLCSYYAAIHPNAVGVTAVDSLRSPEATGFSEFIRDLLRGGVGRVERMFAAYESMTCIRVEDLPWSFVDFLEGLGVPDSLLRRCLSIDPVNVTAPERLPIWNKSLQSLVMVSEGEFIERYEY